MLVGISIATLLWTLGYVSPLYRAQNIEKIKLAIPAKSMGYLPMYVAIHRGFMRDEALDLEIPNMRPNIAHSALLGGDIEYHGLAESGLRLAAKGSPMKSIFYSLRSPLFLNGEASDQDRSRSERQDHRHQLLRRIKVSGAIRSIEIRVVQEDHCRRFLRLTSFFSYSINCPAAVLRLRAVRDISGEARNWKYISIS